MKQLPFKASKPFSLGIELELQIINPQNGNLFERAKDLIRNIRGTAYTKHIKPELTQSMIELNSSAHLHPADLLKEMLKIRKFMIKQSEELDILFAGGGTHPFQLWKHRKIFPTLRFKNLSRRHGYLAKQHTVFGQHIHIGCSNSTQAIYLTQVLERYIPHFIALSASSPFYQGVDTSFDSARLNIFANFATSGFMPLMKNWTDFSSYYKKLRRVNIIKSMKDIYWDIRPKGEFGTVEIRICDTPLTLKRAVLLAAFAQTLAHYLLTKKPIKPIAFDPIIYNYNRFQAIRYGFDGVIIDPYALKPIAIDQDLLSLIEAIKHDAKTLGNLEYLTKIKKIVLEKNNDSKLLREKLKKTKSFQRLALTQANLWMNK